MEASNLGECKGIHKSDSTENGELGLWQRGGLLESIFLGFEGGEERSSLVCSVHGCECCEKFSGL